MSRFWCSFLSRWRAVVNPLVDAEGADEAASVDVVVPPHWWFVWSSCEFFLQQSERSQRFRLCSGSCPAHPVEREEERGEEEEDGEEAVGGKRRGREARM